MDGRKRARTEDDEDSPHKSSSYNVCDPCRGRKVRCGRERPICANCDKAGQECTWNGHGRKPSQSTAFKDAVARIGTQLERLEQNVYKIQGTLQGLQAYNHSSNNGNSLAPAQPWWTDPSIRRETANLASNDTALGKRIPWAVERRAFHLTEDREIYSGPTSLHCLILDAQEFILDPMSRALIVKKHEAALFKARLEALLLSPSVSARGDDGDDLPPAMPPMAILEAMIEPYFEQINPTFPLWTLEGLRSQIALYQAGHTACAVSANNIILLTLTAKFIRAASQKDSDLSPEEQTFSSMENELTGPFVTNARRAAKNTDKLLAPKLANLQALLSLCLIAPHCLVEGAIYRIFHQALYLSRLMGLSGRECPSEDPDDMTQAELQERRNVLHCLCIISTSISWMTGLQTGSLFTDSFLNGPPKMAAMLFHEPSQWEARVTLARIEQEALNKLFAPNQTITGSHSFYTCTTQLSLDLDNWYHTYYTEVISERRETKEQPEKQPGADFTIRYYFLRAILIHADGRDQKLSAESMEASRRLIQLMVGGWRTGSDLGHYTSLTCQLLSCISSTLVRMLAEVHKGEGTANKRLAIDLDLLRSLQSIFKAVVTLSHRESYATRLAAFVDVLFDLAAASHACSSPVLEAPPSGPTPDSVDSIFSSLPDFLRDASCTSSTSQSAASYTFFNLPPHLPQDVNDPLSMKSVQKNIESHLELETGICDDSGNNWWISPFSQDTMAAAEVMLTPRTSIDGPIRY